MEISHVPPISLEKSKMGKPKQVKKAGKNRVKISALLGWVCADLTKDSVLVNLVMRTPPFHFFHYSIKRSAVYEWSVNFLGDSAAPAAGYFANSGKVTKAPLGVGTHDSIVLSAPPPAPLYGGTLEM